MIEYPHIVCRRYSRIFARIGEGRREMVRPDIPGHADVCRDLDTEYESFAKLFYASYRYSV